MYHSIWEPMSSISFFKPDFRNLLMVNSRDPFYIVPCWKYYLIHKIPPYLTLCKYKPLSWTYILKKLIFFRKGEGSYAHHAPSSTSYPFCSTTFFLTPLCSTPVHSLAPVSAITCFLHFCLPWIFPLKLSPFNLTLLPYHFASPI